MTRNLTGNLKKVVLLAVAVLMIAPPAFARARVSILGAGDYYGLTKFGSFTDPVSGGEAEIKGDIGFGGGLLAEFPLGRAVGLELGGIFVSRKIKSSATLAGETLSSTTSTKTLNVPGAFRFWLARGFSFHAGGYYERYLEDGGGNDYGVTAGFRLGIPTKSGLFFIEPRYNHGMKKEDGSTINNKSILGLVGYTF